MPPTPRPFCRRDLIGLLIILALAFGLRCLAWPGIIDFKLDEASNSRLAVAWGQDGEFPLYGVTSSTGVPTPPNAAWILAPPYFIAPDPLLATAWGGLLSALSVALGYWLIHRYFGTWAALTAGLLHAASTWPVYYARKVWTPSTMPLFVLLTITAGVLGFIEGRRRWQAAHVFLLAWTVGAHFSAIPLVFVSAYLMLARWRQIDRRMVTLGVLVTAVITVPFVIGVVNNPNIVMLEGAEIQSHVVQINAKALEYSVQNAFGTGLHRWADLDAQPDHPTYTGQTGAVLGLAVLIPALLLLGVYSWRHRREAIGMFGFTVLVWSFSYIMAFTLEWAPIHPHYFMALWPAPYLVIGAALALLAEHRPTFRYPHWVAAIGAAIVLVLAGGQIVSLNNFYTYAGAHFTSGDFGMPLGMKMQGAHAALDLLAETDATEIIVVGDGDRPYQYEGPGAFDVMLHNVPHRFVDGAISAVLPDHPAVILLQPHGRPADAWYIAAASIAERIPLRENEGDYTLLLYDPTQRDVLIDDFARTEAPNLLGNGARVLGHRRAGMNIEVAWTVESVPDTVTSYHFVTYFLAPIEDSVQGQADGPTHWAAYWQPGDLIINWFPLAELRDPPAGLELRTGMYTYPDIVRVPLVDDEEGQPIGDSVQLTGP